MNRRNLRAFTLLTSFAFLVLLLPSRGLTQNQTLQGSVRQNEGPFVDIIEAGSNTSAVANRNGGVYCDWMQGACNMLHAYVAFINQEGTARSDCLGPMEQGVEFERQEQSLKGPQSYQLDKEKNDLEQKRDRVLATVPPDCFAAQPHSNVPGNNSGTQPRPYPKRPQGPFQPQPRPNSPSPNPYPNSQTPIPPYLQYNPDGSIGPYACPDCPNGTYCYYPPKAMAKWCTSSKGVPADEISSNPFPQPNYPSPNPSPLPSDNAPKPQLNGKVTKNTIPPSLLEWLKRFRRLMGKEWDARTRIETERIQCGIDYVIRYDGSVSNVAELLPNYKTLSCYPSDARYQDQVRQLMTGFPMERIPLPTGTKPFELDAHGNFTVKTGPALPSTFEDTNIQVTW